MSAEPEAKVSAPAEVVLRGWIHVSDPAFIPPYDEPLMAWEDETIHHMKTHEDCSGGTCPGSDDALRGDSRKLMKADFKNGEEVEIVIRRKPAV